MDDSVENINEKIERKKIVKIAHITDSHISPVGFLDEKNDVFKDLPSFNRFVLKSVKSPNFYPEPIFIECLQDLVKENVDHIIHTGDITNLGSEEEHKHNRELIDTHCLKKILESREDLKNVSDVLSICPGNHDFYLDFNLKPDYFAKYYRDTSSREDSVETKEDDEDEDEEEEEGEDNEKEEKEKDEGELYPYVKVVMGNIIVICLNTRIPPLDNHMNGKIDPEELKFLTKKVKEIENSRKETNFFKILALHHNPVQRWPKLLGFLDKKSSFSAHDRSLVMEFVKELSIQLCLCGHTHIYHNVVVDDALVVDSGSCCCTGGGVLLIGRWIEKNPCYSLFTIEDDKIINFEKKIYNKEKKKFETYSMKLDEENKKYVLDGHEESEEEENVDVKIVKENDDNEV